MKRPSIRELGKKIKQAREIVESGRVELINHAVIAADAIELRYQVLEIKRVLYNILGEVSVDDYVGNYPPQKSYESIIKGGELFAFRWMSDSFSKEVYLKFTLKNETLYIVSLHENR